MRLATFNILHGRSPGDRKVDLDRFGAAVAALDADVLALQEVDRNQPRSHGADLTAVAAEAMGAVAHRFAATIAGRPGLWTATARDPAPDSAQYGIALLSRWPVRSWDVLDLPALRRKVPMVRARRRPALVGDEPRRAVVAVVEAPDGPVTVVATHLSLIPGWNAVQLRHLVRRLRNLPRPAVLTGDLNLRGHRPVQITGWRSVADALTFPAHRPTRQLDHVLVDGALHAEGQALAVDTGVSDHRALVVELRTGGPAPG